MRPDPRSRTTFANPPSNRGHAIRSTRGVKRVLPLLLFAACSRSPATPTLVNAGTGSQRGELERGMANCPSAVAGANTELVMTEIGVDLIITAHDPETRRELRARAERHVRMGDPAGLPEHSGLHGGPGWMGHCPIIHDATTVTSTHTKTGVIVHVRALVPSKVKALQEETRARVAGLQAHAEC